MQNVVRALAATCCLSLPLVSCSTAPSPSLEVPSLDGVNITFSHRGASPNLLDLHLGESGAKDLSDKPGADIWLRLSNQSPWAISLPTQSLYIGRPLRLVPTGPTGNAAAMADGSEVALLFTSSEGQFGAGDMSWRSVLAPGNSLIFNVPRRYLRGKRFIYVDYAAYTTAVLAGREAPSTFRAHFDSSAVPKQ